MILIKFFGWVIFFTLCLGLFMRLFGRPISRWLLRRLIRKAEQQMEDQSRAYQRYQESNPFEDNIYINDETRVRVPKGFQEKQNRKRKEKIREQMEIEEVEFEEID